MYLNIVWLIGSFIIFTISVLLIQRRIQKQKDKKKYKYLKSNYRHCMVK